MKLHPLIGFGILNKSQRPIFKAAAIIAHEHHERWDGNGYPQGKSGENIHIFGRIVGLVDVFDALFSNRVYRKAMSLEKALSIIKEGRGSHFEPRLVDLFLDNLPRFLAIAERYFDDKERDRISDLVKSPDILAEARSVAVSRTRQTGATGTR